jgi:hypothetical protein
MADLPESITASQQYLTDFSRIVNEGGSVEDVVNAVLKLHGDRDNPRTLWHSARTAVANGVSHIPQSCPRGGQTSRESADSPPGGRPHRDPGELSRSLLWPSLQERVARLRRRAAEVGPEFELRLATTS